MGHADKEKELIEAYKNATDTDVKDFVEDVLAGREKLNYVTVAFLPDRAAEKSKELTGKQITGNRVVLDISGVRHIENRHGKNGKQDHSMSNPEDIARMGYVIMNFDDITYNGQTSLNHMDENGKPSPMVQFSKRINGTFYVVQTVGAVKSKRNYIVTAYISKA